MPTPIGQIDPDVKMPAAVRAAAARSEEFYKPAEPAPAPQTKAAELPLTTAPVAPAAPVDAPDPASPPAGENWEHKYKSLEGRYRSSEQRLRTLSDEVTNLRGLLTTVQAPAPEPAAPATPKKFVTPQEEELYGTDFLDVVAKRAKEALPEVEELKDTVKQLTERLARVDNTVSVDARQRMLNTLDSRLGNWREINENSAFISWLQLPDPYSGAIRHSLLKAAYDRNEAGRVLAFFNGFLAEEAAVAPAEHQPAPTPAVEKVPLESLAAPGRARSAAGQPPAEKPTFTRAQIAKFYVDVAAGKYEGRDADKNKLEAQIFDAQRGGRIR